jgi:uncharacterized protein YecT (DUF1311 family)
MKTAMRLYRAFVLLIASCSTFLFAADPAVTLPTITNAIARKGASTPAPTLRFIAILLRLAISPSRIPVIFISVLFFFTSPARSQESTEVGNSCAAKSQLVMPFLCIEESVVDCRISINPQEQLHCAASKLHEADTELNRLYSRVMKKFEMPSDQYVDFKNARRALIEGQRAWVKFKKSDCEIPGYLNTKGSIQSAEIVDCELRHTKSRISDLRIYLAP